MRRLRSARRSPRRHPLTIERRSRTVRPGAGVARDGDRDHSPASSPSVHSLAGQLSTGGAFDMEGFCGGGAFDY